MLRKRIEFEYTNGLQGNWKKKRFDGTNGVILLPAHSILRGPTCLVLDKEDLHRFQQKETRRPVARITFSYQHPDNPVSKWDRIKLKRDTSPEFRGWECKPEFLLISELNAYKKRCLTESTKEVSILDWNVKKLPKSGEYRPVPPTYCMVLYEDRTGELLPFHEVVDAVEWSDHNRQPGELYDINHIILPVGESGYHYAIRPSQLSALSRIQMVSVKATVSGKEGFEDSFDTISIEDRIEPPTIQTTKIKKILELCLYFPQLVYLERCAEKQMEDQNTLRVDIHMHAEYDVHLSISDMELETGFQLFDCICKLSQLAHEKLDRLFDPK